jgi:DnaJ-class molecular chaperone
MNYYSTLGINPGASPDEIKKAFKKAAMKHHPDRGGDEAAFKQINEAYEVLSDPQKKQMVDMGVDPLNQNQGRGRPNDFHFHTGAGSFEDVFAHFGFNPFGGAGFQQQQRRRNSSIQVTIEVGFLDVLQGKSMDAEIGMPGGRKKLVTINIPSGVEHGQQIKYGGMGDTSIPGSPPGDLIVNVRVKPHEVFQREQSNLICEWKMPVWDAILGSVINITALDGRTIAITIPAGTQPDTVFSCSNEGLPDVRTKVRGNLLVKIKVGIPKNLSDGQKEIIQQLKNGI